MNGREKATLVWLGVGLLLTLRSRELRSALWAFAKALAQPAVAGLIAALATWTSALVLLARQIGLWDADALADTVVWFLTVGIVFFFSLDAVKRPGFFGTTARRAIAITVFVEGYVNLVVLPFAVELVLMPFVTVVVLLAAFSEGRAEYAPAHRVLNVALSLVGIVFLTYVTVRLIGDFDAEHTGRALALPVWLTLGVLPFIYAVGLWSAYQEAFIRIDLRADRARARRQAKWALMRVARLRASAVGSLCGQWIWELVQASSPAAARAVVRRCRAAARMGADRS